MATYEYKCPKDGHITPVKRGMTEKEIIPYCDKCNEPMKRIYTAAPVKFDAPGFYSTGG